MPRTMKPSGPSRWTGLENGGPLSWDQIWIPGQLRLLTLAVVARRHCSESQLIFGGGDERADHSVLPGSVTQRPGVHLAQPEQESADVCIAPQITEVLCGDESAIVFLINEWPIGDRILWIVIRQPIHHRARTTGRE